MNTMDTTPGDWEAQLIDYSLGVMEPGEAALFEMQLEECRQHVKLAQQYQQTLGWLGSALPPAEPPEGHKNRLMSRITSASQPSGATGEPDEPGATGVPGQDQGALLAVSSNVHSAQEQTIADGRVPEAAGVAAQLAEPAKMAVLGQYRESHRGVSTGLVMTLGALAAALILLVGIWGWNAQNNAQQAMTQVADLNSQVAQLSGRLDAKSKELDAATSKPYIPGDYTAFQLQPAPGYPEVSAVVLYSPNRKDALLIANGLTPLPTGKVYELWLAQKAGAPVPAGTFDAFAQGSTNHETTAQQNIGQYAGFAVTIENAPGETQPKGPEVAAGKFATP